MKFSETHEPNSTAYLRAHQFRPREMRGAYFVSVPIHSTTDLDQIRSFYEAAARGGVRGACLFSDRAPLRE
jgi:hypothetical protein